MASWTRVEVAVMEINWQLSGVMRRRGDGERTNVPGGPWPPDPWSYL